MNIEAKPVYDPKKPYTWEPEDTFTITGLELDAINRALFNQLNSAEAQQVVKVIAAYQATQDVIQRYVESGIIKEKIS